MGILIIKDLLVQKRMGVWLLFFGLFLPFAVVGSFGASAVTLCIVVFTYMLLTGSIARSDQNGHSDVLLLSLPLSRKTVVLSKYVSVLLYYCAGIVLYSGLSAAQSLLPGVTRPMTMTVDGMILSLCGVVFFSGIYLPVYFKVGHTGARIVTIVIFMVIPLIMVAGQKGIGRSRYFRRIVEPFKAVVAGLNDGMVDLLIIYLCVAGLCASAWLSIWWYRKRDF